MPFESIVETVRRAAGGLLVLFFVLLTLCVVLFQQIQSLLLLLCKTHAGTTDSGLFAPCSVSIIELSGLEETSRII